MILLATKENYIAIKNIKTFKNLGYESLHATSSKEAIVLLKNNPTINLLIVDTDSFDNIITFIEDILAIRNIPIMYLTSKNERALVEKFNNVPD